MKAAITFTRSNFDKMYNHVIQGRDEEAAFLLCGVAETHSSTNILVREVVAVPDSAFIIKGGAFLKIDPEFMMPIIKQARLDKLSVISVHSHPFSRHNVTFSSIDYGGDAVLIPKICSRVPDRPHGHIVVGRNSLDARLWKKNAYDGVPVDEVKIVGKKFQKIYPTSSPASADSRLSEMHQRQILAVGEEAQIRIQQMKVGIVGLGGIGSQVFQQLAHLGVRYFVLIDPDVVEESNRSRLVGSKSEDAKARTPKVAIMKRIAGDIDSRIKIMAIQDSIYNLSVARTLIDVDVVFCCTDNLHSRMVLNRMAFQYLIPLIDLGIDIQASQEGKITSAGGRVMTMLPDGPCLDCMGMLDAQVISDEISSLGEGVLTTGAYVTGAEVPNPSVISLNGVVASLGVTEFLNMLTELESRRGQDTYKVYRVLDGDVRAVAMKPINQCAICKEVQAQGDAVQLPCRLDR